MAWIKEPTYTNTGTVISSIFRNWEDFSVNWDSLSPQEDFELVGASSSELIVFGYEFNNINSHWDATNNDWDAYQFLHTPETETSSMVAGNATTYQWQDYNYNWDATALDWEDSFALDAEEGLDYYDYFFNRVPFIFNRWNKHFADKSFLWKDESSDFYSIPLLGDWDGNDTLWNKSAVAWDSFHPSGAEVYSGTLLAATSIDYSAGEWGDITTDWEDYQLGWSSLVLELEDTSVSSLTTTSSTNIVPIWDFSKINNNWEDLSNEWDSMYLGVE